MINILYWSQSPKEVESLSDQHPLNHILHYTTPPLAFSQSMHPKLGPTSSNIPQLWCDRTSKKKKKKKCLCTPFIVPTPLYASILRLEAKGGPRRRSQAQKRWLIGPITQIPQSKRLLEQVYETIVKDWRCTYCNHPPPGWKMNQINQRSLIVKSAWNDL